MLMLVSPVTTWSYAYAYDAGENHLVWKKRRVGNLVLRLFISRQMKEPGNEVGGWEFRSN